MCRDCHADVHRGEFKEDCATCHTATFKKVPFDHAARTLRADRAPRGARLRALPRGRRDGRTVANRRGRSRRSRWCSRACRPPARRATRTCTRGRRDRPARAATTPRAFKPVKAYTHPRRARALLRRAARDGRLPRVPREGDARLAGAPAPAPTDPSVRGPSRGHPPPARAATPTRTRRSSARPASGATSPAKGLPRGAGSRTRPRRSRSPAGTSPSRAGSATPASRARSPRRRPPPSPRTRREGPRPALQGPRHGLRVVPQGRAPRPARDECEGCHSPQAFTRARSTRTPRSRPRSSRAARDAGVHVVPQARIGGRSRRAAASPSASSGPAPAARRATGEGRAPGRARPRLRALPHARALAVGRRARSTRWGSSRSRAGTSRSPAPAATSTASRAARRPSASTATGSGGRTTATRRGWATQCEQCHRPTSWTAVQLEPRGPGRARRSAASTGRSAATRATRTGASWAAPWRASSCHMADYQRTAQPNHAAAGFPTDCEVCHQPSHTVVVTRPRSRTAALPAGGRARDAAVRGVPQERRLQGHAARLRRLPPADYQTDDEPEPRGGRLPDRLRVVPPARPTRAGRGAAFNHTGVFPLVGVARDAGVHRVPQEQRLQGHAARLRRLPPGRLPDARRARTTPPPASRRRARRATSATAPTWSSGDVQPRAVLPAGRASTPRRRAPRATRTASTRARRATASAATGRLPADDEPEPRRGRLPDRVRDRATSATDAALEQAHVQPRARLPAGRGARDAGVRALPQEQRLQGHAARLRRLPPADYQTHDESEPRRGRLPDHLRVLPPADRRRRGPGRRFNHDAVFPLVGAHATQACAACHKNGVYKGTPRDCVGCHLADYQQTTNPNHAAAGFPTTCEHVPPAERRRRGASGGFNHASVFPLVGRPRHAGVRGVPQEQRLQGHAARLRRLPPGRLPADDEPEPRGGRLPDDLRVVPPARAAPSWSRRRLQPRVGLPAGRASTPRRRARRATRTTSTRARRATASAATRPTTSRRRTRTTPRPASRRPASSATRRGAAVDRELQPQPVLPAARAAPATQPCSRVPQEQRLQGHADAPASAATRRTTTRRANPNHVAAGFPTTCESCHKAERHVVDAGRLQPHVVPDHDRAGTPASRAGRATRRPTTTRCSRA